MKRLTLLTLLIFFALSLISCGEEEELQGSNDNDTPSAGDTGDSGVDDASDTGDLTDGDVTTDEVINDMSPDDDAVIIMECTPGDTNECYSGPTGTKDVGACKAGAMTCIEDGSGWGACKGEVLPIAEICGDTIDQDCDGVDQTEANAIDIDGDGFTYCEGDCCELGSQCVNPERVGPASFEVPNNNNDDNCNGEVDEQVVCDTGLSKTLNKDDVPGNAIKLAKGMELCAPWLESAEISLTGAPAEEQIDDGCCEETCSPTARMSLPLPMFDDNYQTYMVTSQFGAQLVPFQGDALSILSTGQWDKPTMSAVCADIESGDMKTASPIPEDWANMQYECTEPGGDLCPLGTPTPPGSYTNTCSGTPPLGADPIMLTINAKVPNNANAFSFKVFFLAIEYPQTVCQGYNDFFVALIDSTYNAENPGSEFMNPVDKNLAMDENKNPLGVNMAPVKGDKGGIFTVCSTAPECNSMPGMGTNPYGVCQGDQILEGTGYEAVSQFGIGCIGHGGTGWLTLQGNVVPGETMKLRIALWEQGKVAYGRDHSYDTTVLLDNFEWHETPLKPGMGGR
ncbi:hypothetical protein KAH37_04030 [bacterium]|nr:hypothetical protein [bacterium]